MHLDFLTGPGKQAFETALLKSDTAAVSIDLGIGAKIKAIRGGGAAAAGAAAAGAAAVARRGP